MSNGNISPLLIFVHIERFCGTTLNYSMLVNLPGVIAPKANLQINHETAQVLFLTTDLKT